MLIGYYHPKTGYYDVDSAQTVLDRVITVFYDKVILRDYVNTKTRSQFTNIGIIPKEQDSKPLSSVKKNMKSKRIQKKPASSKKKELKPKPKKIQVRTSARVNLDS